MVYGYYSYYGFTVIVVDGMTRDFSSEEEAREIYDRICLINGPEELEEPDGTIDELSEEGYL